MKKRYTYTKIFFAALLLLAVELTFGAITTGTTDDSKNKYSLRNLNTSNRHFYSLSTFNTNSFHYTGSGSLNIYQQNSSNQLQVQSMIRMERGNTTYVYPYKYTVKVPKFKTPTAPLIR